MSIPYDIFTGAFLAKIAEYDFSDMDDFSRNEIVDGYMKKAIASFSHICQHDLLNTRDDILRCFFVDIPDDELDEIADIVSQGMLVQWMKPYVFRQDNMELLLNTRDFTSYSPGDFLTKISNAHKDASREFTNMKRDYSYNHGDLTDLHL